MKCEQIEGLLSPYIEDELTAEDRKAVTDHLWMCPDCSSLLSLLQETTGSLSEFPELEVSNDLMAKLYALPQTKRKFKLSINFLLKPSLQPILAAATVLMTLISFYTFNPDKANIDKAINRQLHQGYRKVGSLYSKAESFAVSLGHHKDSILDSIKSAKLFGISEE
jgi:predicted anti-sigma-YlaC factor YlaD